MIVAGTVAEVDTLKQLQIEPQLFRLSENKYTICVC